MLFRGETTGSHRKRHSRMVDEILWATVDEKIIEQARNESTAKRPNDRPPDPVLVTKGEHCPSGKIGVSALFNI
jgi:hypothetical protein